MSEDLLKALMSGLGIAAFERRADGGFAMVSPVPPWFTRLLGDGTFPFLGHILEEATRFWNKGSPMMREWGPVADVDEVGHEFHYKVTAVINSGRHYLIFQLDPGADRMRAMLQKVRERELAEEQQASVAKAAAPSMAVVRETADELRALLRQWPGPTSTEPLLELRMALTLKVDELIKRLDLFRQASAS